MKMCHFATLLLATAAMVPQPARAQVAPAAPAQTAGASDYAGEIIPARSWIYKTLSALHKRNIVVTPAENTSFPEPGKLTRYDAALMLSRTVDRIAMQPGDEGTTRATFPVPINRRELYALRRVSNALAREMTAIGVDMEAVNKRFDLLYQDMGPFSDVPTDHWAYESVEKLRKARIVIGYPASTPAPSQSQPPK